MRLNNADNVLGPLQFDNNINTNQTISSEISLLDQHGSTVTLGNVIVLPFNNDSFLYVRPLYVTAASSNGSSFPQLQDVIVGDQNDVQEGTSFAQAVSNLLNNGTPIPGLNNARAGHHRFGTPTPIAIPVDVAHAVAERRHDPDADQHAHRHAPAADHRPGQQDRGRQRGRGGSAQGGQLHRVRRR